MAITALKYTVQEKALILGIESSCDETAASVLRRDGRWVDRNFIIRHRQPR